MEQYRKWGLWMIAVFLLLLLAITAMVFFTDPYFHYHAPIKGLSYSLDNQRYQNDGILQHFDYDALIIGSSMTENFRITEFDELFGTHSVKVPYENGRFKEVGEGLRKALEKNDSLKMVFRSLDPGFFFDDKDYMAYDGNSYPDFLYNGVGLDDVKYIFSKPTVLASVKNLLKTAGGIEADNFDNYSRWAEKAEYGYFYLFYREKQKQPNQGKLTNEEKEKIHDNIEQNFLRDIREYPEVDFLFFVPPYSIWSYDSEFYKGTLIKQLEAEKYVIEMLLPYDNVKIYTYSDDFKLVCNPDNYMDYCHYSGEISSEILQRAAAGKGLLTEKNIEEHFDCIEEFYFGFDYEKLKWPKNVEKRADGSRSVLPEAKMGEKNE